MPAPDLRRLRPPPRAVPLPLLLSLFTGGALAQILWLLAAFSLAAPALVLESTDLRATWALRDSLSQATGTVESTERVSRSTEDGKTTSIFEHRFSFVDAQGRNQQGISYATNRREQDGTEVPVEYRADEPRYSRIAGMRPNQRRGDWLILLLSAGGVVVLGVCLKQRGRLLPLLARGRLAEAELSSVEEAKRDEGPPSVLARYRFEDAFGHQREHLCKVPAKLQPLPERAALLYDKKNPKRAMHIGELPSFLFGSLIAENGQLRGPAWSSLPRRLLIPVLALLGNGFWLAWALWRELGAVG